MVLERATIPRNPANKDELFPAEMASETDAAITLTNVSKWFYGKNNSKVMAISGIDLVIKPGAFVSLVGPSGCGKSTVLNCIAGLESVSRGAITCDGKAINGINVGIGYMTQRDYLLPNRTVIDNVILPLQAIGIKKGSARARAQDIIHLVGLEGFEKSVPHELSGGMMKRVALARTLVYKPQILLMDEPFGNVDAQLKLLLQRLLMSIWKAEQQTVVFVTHDLEEAIALSDQVVVISGRPGSIKEIIEVILPRPRDPVSVRFESAFQKLHERLWSLIDTTGGD